MRIFFHTFRTHLTSNTSLKILLFVDSLVMIAAAMLGPIYALFVQKVGGSVLDASSAGAVFAAAAGITVIISGKVSDNVRRSKWMVIVGYLLIGIGYLLYITVSSIYTLLFVQVLIGFGEAIYVPAFDGLYSKNLDSREQSSEWGAWEAMKYFSTAFGAITGGVIVTKFGFNTIFVLMAMLCFGSALYIYSIFKKIV